MQSKVAGKAQNPKEPKPKDPLLNKSSHLSISGGGSLSAPSFNINEPD